jgi:hypothetical protein
MDLYNGFQEENASPPLTPLLPYPSLSPVSHTKQENTIAPQDTALWYGSKVHPSTPSQLHLLKPNYKRLINKLFRGPRAASGQAARQAGCSYLLRFPVNRRRAAHLRKCFTQYLRASFVLEGD